MRNWLCRFLCKPKIPYDMPRPLYLDKIDVSELISIVHKQFPQVALYFTDNNYETTSVIELQRYLRYDLTDRNTFIYEYYDCDDFSFSLLGSINNELWGMLPFGVMWVQRDGNSPHAVNVFVDDNRKIYIVEPQTDEVFSPPDDWHPYLIII